MTNNITATDVLPLAISYDRFSTRGQMKGDSVRRQSKGAEEFCRKHGLLLIKSYHDFGVSAFRGKNKTEGSLGEIVEQIQDGKIKKGTVIVVEALDRISREKVGDALPWFINILKTGVRIGVVCDDKIFDEASANDPWLLMGSLMKMAAANEESAKKAFRVRESWKSRRMKGVKNTVCPSWLYLDPKTGTYKQFDNRINLIKEIFECTIAGVGTSTIAGMLNERKEPVWEQIVGRQGKRWHPTTIYNLLGNRALLGFYQPGAVDDGEKVSAGDEIADYFPKVLDEMVWLRAQAARKSNTGGAKGKMLTNLFEDRARCLNCMARMKIVTKVVARDRPDHGKVFRYFACSNAEAKAGCPGGEKFNYYEVEAAILDHVPEFKLHDIFASAEEGNEIKETEKQIGAASFKLGELVKRRDRLFYELSLSDQDGPLVDMVRKNIREIISDIQRTQDSLNGLVELKAELEAKHDHRGDAEAIVKQFRETLKDDSLSDYERFKLRSRLATALQSFIDFVWFDFNSDTFDVVLMGGMIVHRFEKTAPVGRGRARKIRYVDSVNHAQTMGDLVVREAFTTMTRERDIEGEDPARIELHNRLTTTTNGTV